MKFIRESAEKRDVIIVQEKTDKVIFKTILQTSNDINSNKRLYRKETIDEGLKLLKKDIDNRSFVGELDHPLEETIERQSVVLYKESSHIITDVYWEGNSLIGIVETLTTENGKNLTNLIKNDKVKVGFSLRAFGDLIPRGDYEEVVGPLTIITWDCVSNPSHKSARILEVTNENYKKIVNEGTKINSDKNGICRFSDCLDNLIENKIIKIKKYFI